MKNLGRVQQGGFCAFIALVLVFGEWVTEGLSDIEGFLSSEAAHYLGL